jgi:hypothetical protein
MTTGKYVRVIAKRGGFCALYRLKTIGVSGWRWEALPDTQQIVYKVVWRHNGGLWSVVDTFANLQYSFSKKTIPVIDGSYLYAFDSLANAQGWICRHLMRSKRVCILSCLAEVVVGVEPRRAKTFLRYVDFWQDVKRGKGVEYEYPPAPQGTVWCKWILPLEEISF